MDAPKLAHAEHACNYSTHTTWLQGASVRELIASG